MFSQNSAVKMPNSNSHSKSKQPVKGSVLVRALKEQNGQTEYILYRGLIRIALYYKVPVVKQWLSYTVEAKNLGFAPFTWLDVPAILIWPWRLGGFLEGCWYLVYFGSLMKLVLISENECNINRIGDLASKSEGKQAKFSFSCPFISTRRCHQYLGWIFTFQIIWSETPSQEFQ